MSDFYSKEHERLFEMMFPDSMEAFAKGKEAMKEGRKSKIFDWDRAAMILRQRGVEYAEAGLAGDWFYTGGPILKDKIPVDPDRTYTYLSSLWAIPQLFIDGEYIDCWIWEEDSPGWNEKTYWPMSALNIFNYSGVDSNEQH